MEPCGTPQHNLVDEEHRFPMEIDNDLTFKYDLNQSKAVPLIPTSSRRLNKIPWSMILKAAVKSSRIRITIFPESIMMLLKYH